MMTTSFKQEYKQEYKQEPSEISPGYQHGCNDDYNFDTYFNFEPNDVATPSISPLSHRSKSVSTPTLISANPVSATVIPGQSNPLFAPPSHQYGQYRQHAGFAPGAMQNTFAVNQADQYGYTGSNYGTIPPTDGYSAEMNISGTYSVGRFTLARLNFLLMCPKIDFPPIDRLLMLTTAHF